MLNARRLGCWACLQSSRKSVSQRSVKRSGSCRCQLLHISCFLMRSNLEDVEHSLMRNLARVQLHNVAPHFGLVHWTLQSVFVVSQHFVRRAGSDGYKTRKRNARGTQEGTRHARAHARDTQEKAAGWYTGLELWRTTSSRNVTWMGLIAPCAKPESNVRISTLDS